MHLALQFVHELLGPLLFFLLQLLFDEYLGELFLLQSGLASELLKRLLVPFVRRLRVVLLLLAGDDFA